MVEITCPPKAERERTVKLNLYIQDWVRKYWTVDTNAKTIMVLLRGESHYFEAAGI